MHTSYRSNKTKVNTWGTTNRPFLKINIYLKKYAKLPNRDHSKVGLAVEVRKKKAALDSEAQIKADRAARPYLVTDKDVEFKGIDD